MTIALYLLKIGQTKINGWSVLTRKYGGISYAARSRLLQADKKLLQTRDLSEQKLSPVVSNNCGKSGEP